VILRFERDLVEPLPPPPLHCLARGRHNEVDPAGKSARPAGVLQSVAAKRRHRGPVHRSFV